MRKQPVLVIAAHPDDEVLGCGGTIARMASEGREVHVLLMADGESARTTSAHKVETKQIEKRGNAAQNASDILGCASVDMLSLPDNRLDRLELLDIVKQIEHFIERFKPVTIFTHHSGDVNIDHCIVHNAVITACRPQPNYVVDEILFFEVPSSTEWRPPTSAAFFTPNFFVDISSTLSTKLNALKTYSDELRQFPHPRSLQAIQVLAQWRGSTVGVNAAESFILGRRIVK